MKEGADDLVTGFSIWAVPGQPEAQELEDIIRTYAQRLGMPPFLPHMTILSGVKGLVAEEATVKLVDLADSMCPMEVEIETVTFKEDLFFQCVFGLLKLTNKLTHAHERAKQIYEVTTDVTFRPHVSDVATGSRAELAQELGSCLGGKRVKMDKLQLWRTLKEVETWELVAEVPLRPGDVYVFRLY
ncbi:unnamed protein product [Peronospora destructor]|uniref:Cyclic phosphodiesterase n=1 Tax=Peronospora destructor TaxID=86335 RepID=A0AAV0V4S2_9STRA|nr:unnamed protein product [Peronospora destructor]